MANQITIDIIHDCTLTFFKVLCYELSHGIVLLGSDWFLSRFVVTVEVAHNLDDKSRGTQKDGSCLARPFACPLG